jgi:hypothetical protein
MLAKLPAQPSPRPALVIGKDVEAGGDEPLEQFGAPSVAIEAQQAAELGRRVLLECLGTLDP